MIVVQTKNVSKSFKETLAVDQVDLTIRKGNIYGLIGKNGAGKTTLMRLIVGLAFPDQGEISLFGAKDDLRYKEKHRLGVLIEQPVFYENLTARQNLDVHRILLDIKDKSVIDEVLKLVKLEDTGKKKAKAFSLGMKQRLGIALALLNKPELLILDEPVNGLDPEGVKEVRDILLDLVENKGITVLISSHILSELSTFATQYGFMDNGRMIEQISAAELQKKNQNSMVFEVSDVNKAVEILKDKFKIIKYRVKNSNVLEINEQVELLNKINKALVLSDIEVRSASVIERTLEDYFLSITGGKNNV